MRFNPEKDRTDDAPFVIDFVAIKSASDVILGLVWLGPLEARQQHLDLQSRVNVYITYWDSGQLGADFPKSIGKGVTIRVLLGQEPGVSGKWFLDELVRLVKTVGIGFEYQMLEESS